MGYRSTPFCHLKLFQEQIQSCCDRDSRKKVISAAEQAGVKQEDYCLPCDFQEGTKVAFYKEIHK